jgi:hypothetical protein
MPPGATAEDFHTLTLASRGAVGLLPTPTCLDHKPRASAYILGTSAGMSWGERGHCRVPQGRCPYTWTVTTQTTQKVGNSDVLGWQPSVEPPVLSPNPFDASHQPCASCATPEPPALPPLLFAHLHSGVPPRASTSLYTSC